MAGLFNTSTTPALPAFLAGPARVPAAQDPQAAIRQVREEARAARQAAAQQAGGAKASAPQSAPAPAMAVQTIGGYTSAYTMSGAIRQLLGRLGSFLATLFPAVTPAPAPAPNPVKPPQGPGVSGDTDFVISSFNILSTNAGKGKGFANSMTRMQWTTQILKERNVSVVGFQEVDATQLKEFKRLVGDEYGTFAGASGKKGYHDTALAWRKDQWKLVQADTITVPSYAGRDSKVPYVRLRNKQTGQEAYFVDVHNPANTKNYHNQDRFRNEAARQETALVKRLLEQSGLPVFLVGDFNSVEEARTIVTQGAPMTAANAQNGKRPGIDWIFGSKGIKFKGFTRTRDGLISKTTDHPVLFTKAHIDG